MGNGSYLPGGNAARKREADHSSPHCALVKNEWSSNFIIHVCLRVTFKDNFNF